MCLGYTLQGGPVRSIDSATSKESQAPLSSPNVTHAAGLLLLSERFPLSAVATGGCMGPRQFSAITTV